MEKYVKTICIRGNVQFIAEAKNETEFSELFDNHFRELKIDLCKYGVFIDYNESDTIEQRKESKRLRNLNQIKITDNG